MLTTHLSVLKKKHEIIDRRIHDELKHPLPDTQRLRLLKSEKLHIKEKIVELEEKTTH